MVLRLIMQNFANLFLLYKLAEKKRKNDFPKDVERRVIDIPF